MATSEQAVADTRRWLERAVVGLNLCPFAKAVLVKDQVHITATQAGDAKGILADFTRELEALVALDARERDTTLLAIPRGMEDFLAFNDLAARAERIVRKRGFEGEIQVAHFHPRFVFAGTDEDDITNFTNRAPWPTLHRLGRAGWDALDVEAKP
jgi:hypothetical protein